MIHHVNNLRFNWVYIKHISKRTICNIFFFLAEGHYNMSITMTFFKKLILVIDDFRIG